MLRQVVKTRDSVIQAVNAPLGLLNRDLPEHGLRAGDLGAVVELYGDEAAEVEFVQGSGRTKALLTLRLVELRAVAHNDVLAVRST